MPIMNGLEFIKALRDLKYETPIVFYTGHGNKELMMEAIKYGAFDFLDKPQLTGLEEVISRGMKEGLQRQNSKIESTEQLISYYQKLLKEIDIKE